MRRSKVISSISSSLLVSPRVSASMTSKILSRSALLLVLQSASLSLPALTPSSKVAVMSSPRMSALSVMTCSATVSVSLTRRKPTIYAPTMSSILS